MPQLVKGGKYVFGWSKVGSGGQIIIPPEAFTEYRLRTCRNVILIPGSKTSGGFGLTRLKSLRNSPLFDVMDKCPGLAEFQVPEGEALELNGKTYCWVKLYRSSIVVPINTLGRYGVKPGDYLLSARGSYLAIGFIAKGPIIEAARRHPEIETYSDMSFVP